MQALIRSWNVFHGNAQPPTRHTYLHQMIELATADDPAVLCLQEVPVWALSHLERWSGMRAHSVVARRPRRPQALAAALTRLHNGLFRSRLAGQANAILVDRSLMSVALGDAQISDGARERRVVQAVRIDGLGVVANLHASNAPAAVVEPELRRAAEFVDSRAAPGAPRILAGDFNIAQPAVAGYETGGAGIDHILAAGIEAGPLTAWPRERRCAGRVLLSDHAPVERLVGALRSA